MSTIGADKENNARYKCIRHYAFILHYIYTGKQDPMQ
jgi:hypothetical protein